MQAFNMPSKEAQELWQQLGDIPVNEDGQIEEPFQDFPAGTQREYIWRWFEEKYDTSVTKLMFNGSVSPQERLYFTPLIQRWINVLFATHPKDSDDYLVSSMVIRGIKESIAIELVSEERHEFELYPDGTSTIDFSDHEPTDDRIFDANNMFVFAYGIALLYGDALRGNNGHIQGQPLEKYIRIRLDEERGDGSAETWTPVKEFPDETDFTEGN